MKHFAPLTAFRPFWLALLLQVAVVTASRAQENKENPRDSFEAFRQKMHQDFSDFRNDIYDHYTDFLNAAWKDFDSFRGVERDPKPKPHEVPKAPDKPAPQPEAPTTPKEVVPAPKPAPTPAPKPEPTPAPPAETPRIEYLNLDFYGLSVKLPELDLPAASELAEMGNGKAFKALSDAEVDTQALPALRDAVKRYALPDWLACDLARKYATELLRTATPEARINLSHFLLIGLGYDARVAYSSSQPLLLIPFKQMVYARTYLDIGENHFHIFTDEIAGIKEEQMRVSTPDMPYNASGLQAVDLIIHKPLNVPGQKKSFQYQYGVVSISGEVNTTLMKMVYRYPQMPIPCYAQSCLDEALRSSVVQQVKGALASKSGITAVNDLLHFIQKGFEYATDDEAHGFEKPYFFEEILYYPVCDCEDRAIFYATLLRRCLGVPNHLIHYPGHECTAVYVPGFSGGTGYTDGGRTYYISDPTYIGADTGMCMPDYQNVAPTVEKW